MAQLPTVRFADVLGYEFVSMPALSAVQVLPGAPGGGGRQRRWPTGCWCPIFDAACAWCEPTWPSAWCRAVAARLPDRPRCASCRSAMPGHSAGLRFATATSRPFRLRPNCWPVQHLARIWPRALRRWRSCTTPQPGAKSPCTGPSALQTLLKTSPKITGLGICTLPCELPNL